jgi:hypothetical protein
MIETWVEDTKNVETFLRIGQQLAMLRNTEEYEDMNNFGQFYFS